jgi:hypothetical protein
MARSPLDDVTNAVKDAAYVSVGLGVIAFQRLQVRRNELNKALSGQADDAKGALGVVGALVGDRLKAVEERIDAAREQLSGYVPGAADR